MQTHTCTRVRTEGDDAERCGEGYDAWRGGAGGAEADEGRHRAAGRHIGNYSYPNIVLNNEYAPSHRWHIGNHNYPNTVLTNEYAADVDRLREPQVSY